MERDSALMLLHEHSIFKNIPGYQLEKFFDICKEKHFIAGDYLIHEGDKGESFFILLNGIVECTKYNPEDKKNLSIFTLSGTQLIGEMSWIDQETRSISAKALTPLQVLEVNFSDIDQLLSKEPELHSIFRRIMRNLSLNLRKTNHKIVNEMVKRLAEYKIRGLLSIFVVYTIIVLNAYTFLVYSISSFLQVATSTTFVGMPIALFFFIIFFIFVKYTGLPLRFFGITLDGWKIALFEGILFTIPLMIAALLTKWILINYVISYQGRALFEPYADFHLSNSSSQYVQLIWLFSVLAYSFISVPMQELLIRGGCQGPLQEALTSKYKVVIAIVASNFVFATQHLLLSFHYVLIALIPGFYFGWLYSRHQTLLGVITAHSLLGIFGTWVVGF